MQQLNGFFNPGDIIEIIKTSKLTTSFHQATILHQEPHQPKTKTTKTNKPKKSNKKQKLYHHFDDHTSDDDDDDEGDLYLVQYKSKEIDIVSYVGINEIRPVPPQNDGICNVGLSVNEKVDVLRDGYWIKGTIVGVLYEGSKYMVGIDGDSDDVPVEVCRSYLRVHRDWCNGSWIPPFDSFVEKESFKMDEGSISSPGTISEVKTEFNGRRVTLRLKGTKTLLKTRFSPGTAIEVKSDEAGYQGSWYLATVVRSVGIGKYLVEYKTLTTEDGMNPLREVANEQDMRPLPPHIPRSNRYNMLDEVDAWYNDGWWEGSIYEVLDEWKYIVYFVTSNEKLVFEHSDLRVHQTWVDGKWMVALKPMSSDLKSRSSKSKKHNKKCQANKAHKIFSKGKIVEVRSDEPGYEGAWYTACIVRSIRKSRFLIEYATLKTEDELNPLREEVEVRNIRPCPPNEVNNDNFLVLQKVDAWYNDGWWAGEVSEVLADKQYKVYFDTSKEVLEFHHMKLRIRREWINGKWINVI